MAHLKLKSGMNIKQDEAFISSFAYLPQMWFCGYILLFSQPQRW